MKYPLELSKIAKIIFPRDEYGMFITPSLDEEDIEEVSLIEDVGENLLVDQDNKLATKELQQVIDALHLRNPIPIKDLLNLEEEKIDTHQQFSDEDFIQAATEVEQVENEVIIQPLTGREQLDILCDALRIVDKRIDDGGVIMKSLRRLQSCIREEVRKEEAEKQVQTKLDRFFK